MTFPQPEFPFLVEKKYQVIQSPGHPGAATRYLKNETPIRRFRLSYRNISGADAALIRSEYDTAKGRAGTTSYQPVDEGSAVTVRFTNDELEFEQASADTWNVEVELEQEVW